MVILSMMTSSMLEVAVSVGYDTQIGNDGQVSTGINSDNQGFGSDKNETDEEWLDEDSNNNEDEEGDEDNQPDIIGELESRLHEDDNVGESEPRLHEPP